LRFIGLIVALTLPPTVTAAQQAPSTADIAKLRPATAGTPAVSQGCPLRATATHIYYVDYKADSTRYVFTSISNPTPNFIPDASATIVIAGGRAIGSFGDGVQQVPVPPHASGEYVVFIDTVRPGSAFKYIRSVSIMC
jgi:hypothetical protein